MDQLPGTAVQTGLLLGIQSSVMQAGHAALEAEFRHPIVDQQEVPQVSQLLLLLLLLFHHAAGAQPTSLPLQLLNGDRHLSAGKGIVS